MGLKKKFAAAVGLLVLASLSLSSCSSPKNAWPWIQIGDSYIQVPPYSYCSDDGGDFSTSSPCSHGSWYDDSGAVTVMIFGSEEKIQEFRDLYNRNEEAERRGDTEGQKEVLEQAYDIPRTWFLYRHLGNRGEESREQLQYKLNSATGNVDSFITINKSVSCFLGDDDSAMGYITMFVCFNEDSYQATGYRYADGIQGFYRAGQNFPDATKRMLNSWTYRQPPGFGQR